MVNKIIIEVEDDVVNITQFDFVGRKVFTDVLKSLMDSYKNHPQAQIERAQSIAAKKAELAQTI